MNSQIIALRCRRVNPWRPSSFFGRLKAEKGKTGEGIQRRRSKIFLYARMVEDFPGLPAWGLCAARV